MSIINYTIDTDTADLSKYETRLILWALGVKLEYRWFKNCAWGVIDSVGQLTDSRSTYRIAKELK